MLGTDNCMEAYVNTKGDLRALKTSSICKWCYCTAKVKKPAHVLAHKYLLCRIEVSQWFLQVSTNQPDWRVFSASLPYHHPSSSDRQTDWPTNSNFGAPSSLDEISPDGSVPSSCLLAGSTDLGSVSGPIQVPRIFCKKSHYHGLKRPVWTGSLHPLFLIFTATLQGRYYTLHFIIKKLTLGSK